jgi:hypothetical protein
MDPRVKPGGDEHRDVLRQENAGKIKPNRRMPATEGRSRDSR